MKPMLIAVLALLAAAPGGSQAASLVPMPPAAARRIDFDQDVQPLLEQRCAHCHGRGKAKGGFRLDTRDTLLQGGDSGPAVIAGRSGESLLIQLVAGVDPDNVMPEKGTRLTPVEVGVLRAWVDQGLAWNPQVNFARRVAKNLAPTRPALPASSLNDNPVDVWVDATLQAQRQHWPRPVSDSVFARRVWLDVTGLPPAPEALERFLEERDANKRGRLVDRLLADGVQYAGHMMSFWNDALRNDYRGTGYIDGGRKQITSWLYSALATNMPYDEFVRQLVNPGEASAGFTRGIVWRGVVNASQIPAMQAAQNISQVFLGTNLKCASCHDSFINDWTLNEAYGLAALYADQPLEIHRCDAPTGQKAVPAFIFAEAGRIDPAATKPDRLRQLAEVISRRENGRLTRTVVNRLWARLFGRGLIEPVEDMDQKAWNQDLLDWLAEDLADHGYDLKRTLRLILTSRAYQLPAVGATEAETGAYVFRGPVVRRLTAEQFRDALGALTTVWHRAPAGELVDFWEGLPAEERAARRATAPAPGLAWIWNTPEAAQDAGTRTVYFRRSFELPDKPAAAYLVLAADDQATVFVNGTRVAAVRGFQRPSIEDIGTQLSAGSNVVAISVSNGGGGGGNGANPAGLLGQLHIELPARTASAPGPGQTTRARDEVSVVRLGTDGRWLTHDRQVPGWEARQLDEAGWVPAAAVGGLAAAPWRVEPRFLASLSNLEPRGRIRTALVEADPLTTALGRPNREQTVLARSSTATTLQALELTNGGTLDQLLAEGARRRLPEAEAAPGDFVRRLFQSALARPPSARESRLGRELLGAAPAVETVQDLMWTVAMLPEFQLIQ